MMNRIVLVGRLTRDPELRRTTTDIAVASFSLAVDDRMKDAEGNRTTTFIDVSVWGNAADNVAKYCRKGSLVGVDGRIHQSRFERKDGTKGSRIEVVADSVQFLESKGKDNVMDGDMPINIPSPIDEDDSKNLDSIDVTDDDLPF